jgi:hypothetical protein
MNGFYFNIQYRQDLQDLQDYLKDIRGLHSSPYVKKNVSYDIYC